MNKLEYLKELKETSDRVKPIMKNYLDGLPGNRKGLYRSVAYLAGERLKEDSLLLKPFLVRLSFEVLGGRDWDKIVPFCAAAELINISSYQSNFSFDGKQMIISQRDKNNQFIAAFITRELALDIVRDTINIIDARQVVRILKCFAESNKNIYVGQYYDLNIITAPYYNMLHDFEVYLNNYIKRCDYLSGVFTEQCALVGGILADADEDHLKSLGSFGRNFGIGLSIVNDVGDLVLLPKSKVNSLKKDYDQYNDLKEGKLTLPIMYVLKYGNSEYKRKLKTLIGKHQITEREKREVMDILVKSGAVAYSKKLANSYRKKAKINLKIFEPTRARNLLSMMVSQLRTNKYFYNLRRFTIGN